MPESSSRAWHQINSRQSGKASWSLAAGPHTQARAGEGGAYGVAGAISRIQGRVEEQHGTDSDAVLGVLAPIAQHP